MVDKQTQQNNPGIQAILFDWSGTISDDRLPVYEANKRIRSHYGLAPNTFEEFLETVRMTPVEYYHENGVTDTADQIYELYRQSFQSALESGIRPMAFPGTTDVLRRLDQAGLSLGVVSSHPQVYLAQEAEEYELLPQLDVLHGDTRDKIESLKEVCLAMELERSRTLYVGDTIYDIRSAREAGLITAGVSTGYHTHEALEAEKPDHLFTRLSQVMALVGV